MVAPIPVVFCALPFLPDFPFKEIISQMAGLSILPPGLLAVFTSVMIYHDTRRSLWRFPLGATRFFGSVASFAALGNLIAYHTLAAGCLYAAAMLLKMVPELRLLHRGQNPDAAWSPDVHSAGLQSVPLGTVMRARFAFAILAMFTGLIHPWSALPLLLIAELFERQLHFQSVHAPKMPGNFGPQPH